MEEVSCSHMRRLILSSIRHNYDDIEKIGNVFKNKKVFYIEVVLADFSKPKSNLGTVLSSFLVIIITILIMFIAFYQYLLQL